MNMINNQNEQDEEDEEINQNQKDSEESEEDPIDPRLAEMMAFVGEAKTKRTKSDKVLDKYGKNLNHAALAGEFDGFSGRDAEISKIIEILCHKDRPNPVLIGNPGSGKTAIVQEIAKRITLNLVPERLKNFQIYYIDVNSLVSGTMFRGQLEQKIDDIIQACYKARNIIIFFDEIHMLKGSGDSLGSENVFLNTFKPALLSGKFKMIGATTLDEFSASLSKDEAFLRRIQTVEIADLSKQDILNILKNKIPVYEEFHTAKFDLDDLELVYNYADRFMPDKFFPDKAFAVIDSVLTKLSIADYLSNTNRVSEVTINNDIIKLEQTKLAAIAKESFDEAMDITRRIKYLKNQILEIQKEKGNKESDEMPVSDKSSVIKSVRDLSNNEIVDSEESTKKIYKELPDILSKSVIGQDQSVKTVAKLVQNAKFGFPNRTKPFASMLFLGPTGTGKTLLAKTLAKTLFGSRNFFKFDMSEYDTEISASKLLGSNPGYVGYNSPSPLQVAIKTNPFAVFLFDEIEKAHPKILDVFLQILDDGKVKTGSNITLNFRNAIIIMTSNIGSQHYKENRKIALDPSLRTNDADLKSLIIGSLHNYMRPEMINRFDEILIFNKITRNDCLKIVELEIASLLEIAKEKNITFTVTDKAKEHIIENSFSEEFGARNISRYVTKKINTAVSDLLIQIDKEDNVSIIIDLEDDKYVAREQQP